MYIKQAISAIITLIILFSVSPAFAFKTDDFSQEEDNINYAPIVIAATKTECYYKDYGVEKWICEEKEVSSSSAYSGPCTDSFATGILFGIGGGVVGALLFKPAGASYIFDITGGVVGAVGGFALGYLICEMMN